ncbi:MAG: protein translocase subunit SecF [Brevinema sp.]
MQEKHVDFLKYRIIALVLFVILTLSGLVMYVTKGIKLGTDFSGGIRIEFTAPSDVESLRKMIDNNKIAITTFQKPDQQQSFLLTAPSELQKEGSGQYLLDPVVKQLGKDQVQILASEFIGPSVGDNFVKQSLRLLAIVVALILVYVAFRFDFMYGLGAIGALIHDMVILLIFTILFSIPVDLTILAAFLTILGYSINDTIVIFDRIRENHNITPNEDLSEIINKSIKLSLNRTILTSITTLFIAIAIFVWAGDTLRNFGLLLVIGIISGTYSSIFVASPITYALWKLKNPTK